MTNVYDQFDSAFANVSAWAILRDGKPVGRVALKHGGAVSAFIHLTGSQMANARAGGGEYDRATAAVRSAIAKLDRAIADPARATLIEAMQAGEAREGSGGRDWTSIVTAAGFTLVAVL